MHYGQQHRCRGRAAARFISGVMVAMSSIQQVAGQVAETQVQIPASRWSAAEGRWIINDGVACDVRGLTRAANGELLLVVRQGPDRLWRSRDNGDTWALETDFSTDTAVEYAMTDGWTTLRSGRVIACAYWPGFGKLEQTAKPYSYGPPGRKALQPYEYGHPGGLKQSARCIYSDDNGRTWRLTEPLPLPADRELRPLYGRIVELENGDLLITAHVFADLDDQRNWIFSPCVMRSKDGGITWSEPQIVARGESDIGNCYNELGVLPVGGARLMAFFRMNPTHYGRTIYGFRAFSNDAGQTWTPPDQCLQGPAEMDLLHLPGGGIAVTGVSLSGISFSVSFDGGLSWAYRTHIYDKHPDQPEWDWHYSNTVALDSDTLLTVHARQNEELVFGTYARWLRRTPLPELPESRNTYVAGAIPTHRWVIREVRPVHSGSDAARDPQLARLANGDLLVGMQLGPAARRTVVKRSSDGGVTWGEPLAVAEFSSLPQAATRGMTVLGSGRIVMACAEYSAEDGAYASAGEFMPGLPRFTATGFSSRSVLRVALSDDDGANWRLTRPVAVDAFRSVMPAGGFVELPGGALLMPVYGPASAQDMDGALESCGLLQSTDAGESWEFLALVAPADRRQGRSFRNASILRLADGNLLAVVETRYPSRGPASERNLSFTVSTDNGRHWSEPVATWPGWDPLLAALPDGGVFCAQSVWTGLKFEVSYNLGVTWDYQDQLYYHDPRRVWGAGSSSLAVVDKDTALVVYQLPDGNVDACWLRRVPRDGKLARARLE